MTKIKGCGLLPATEQLETNDSVVASGFSFFHSYIAGHKKGLSCRTAFSMTGLAQAK
jgi:hypothetical protein